MPLLGGYKVVLTLAAALTAGVFAGMSLGGFAVGDAFFFYRTREPLYSPIEVSQAATESPAYSASPYPPIAVPAAYAHPAEFSAAWRPEAEYPLERPYELSEAYGETANVHYGDVAEVGDELPAAIRSGAAPVARAPADGDEWESVGDTARIRRASQTDRSDLTDQSFVSANAPAVPLQRSLATPEKGDTAGPRLDPLFAPRPQAKVPTLERPLLGTNPKRSDSAGDEGTSNSALRDRAG